MKNLSKLIVLLGVLYSILVIILGFNSKVSFGNGLGDLGMILSLILVNLIVLGFFYISKKCKKFQVVARLACITLVIWMIVYYSLCLSLWRGPEQVWNGELFLG